VNPLDQTVVENRPDGSVAKTTFDPAGNPTDACFWSAAPFDACLPVGSSWTNPPSQVTTTAYDARNQRVTLINGATNGTTTYDPDHNYRLKASYLPTANDREVQTLYTYDGRHRTATITVQTCTVNAAHACTDTPVDNGGDTYTYDDADNVTSVIESGDGGAAPTWNYCYDGRHQLVERQTTSACSASSHDEHYGYDAAGNRTQTVSGATTTNFAYDTQGRLCKVGGTSCASPNVTYDSAGRTTSWAGWTFGYDAEGRLVSACKSATCAAGYDKVTYAYDGEGHRTQIQTTSAGGAAATTDFGYQGDAIVEETLTDAAHPSGSIVRRYAVDEAGSIVKMTIPAGEPNAGDYLVNWTGHGDALNLLRVEADGTTILANSFSYTSWGAPSTTTHNSIPDLGFRFLYVGQQDVQWDNAFGLGLLYMHARHYAPALARFLQPDPGQSDRNLYAYAINNPCTDMDPLGTRPQRRTCSEILSEIWFYRNVLDRRADELLTNARRLPAYGRFSVAGHQQQFRDAQRHLQNLMNEWWGNGCGGPSGRIPVPQVFRYAYMPAPAPVTRAVRAPSGGFNPWPWIVGGGVALWWGAKVLAPACGPFAPACALAF
jgi:RHS repeat-associated protein